MAKLIKNWEELSKETSPTHIIKIDVGMCNGWIHPKDKSKRYDDSYYLSTHTFYGDSYEGWTKILQDCGFDVELANWDE